MIKPCSHGRTDCDWGKLYLFTNFLMGILLKDVFLRDFERSCSTQKKGIIEQGSKIRFFYTTAFGQLAKSSIRVLKFFHISKFAQKTSRVFIMISSNVVNNAFQVCKRIFWEKNFPWENRKICINCFFQQNVLQVLADFVR